MKALVLWTIFLIFLAFISPLLAFFVFLFACSATGILTHEEKRARASCQINTDPPNCRQQ